MKKDKLIGAASMLLLLTLPATFGYWIGVSFIKAYLIAFTTTISVMVAYAIIEYMNHQFKKLIGC